MDGTLNILQETARQINEMRVIDGDVDVLVLKLFEIGILEPEKAKRFLVKKFYFDKIHDHNYSCKAAALEAAVKFKVSESFVNKCIYYYKDIKVF